MAHELSDTYHLRTLPIECMALLISSLCRLRVSARTVRDILSLSSVVDRPFQATNDLTKMRLRCWPPAGPRVVVG